VNCFRPCARNGANVLEFGNQIPTERRTNIRVISQKCVGSKDQLMMVRTSQSRNQREAFRNMDVAKSFLNEIPMFDSHLKRSRDELIKRDRKAKQDRKMHMRNRME
jgi:hypothetical protein